MPAGHLLWVYAQTVDAFVDAHGRSPEPRDRGRDPRAVTAAGPKRAPRFALRSRLGAIAAAAMLSSAALAQQHDPIGRIAAENAELSTQAAAAATALDRAGAELARLQKSKDALAESLRRIERRAEVHALGREFAETVIDRLRLLPRAERFAAARAARADLLAATSDAALRVERERDELGDLEAAVVARLAAAAPPVAQAARPQVEAALRGALAGRSDLLARVAGLQERLVQTLREVGEAERALEARGEAAHAELTRLLFWIPAPPVTQTLSRFPPALAWTVSPAHWRAAAAVVQQEFARSPFWPALALLAAAILYAARGRLRQALVSLAPGSVTYERYRVGHALAALAITFGLAAPGATVLWTLALLLGGAPEAQAFVHALGAACAAVARLLLALSAFAWLLDRGGMAVGHFGWDEATAGFAVRVLRRFMVFFVPLIFVAALNSGDYAPFANRESLGRLMFNLAMIAVAALLVMLLRRGSPLMRLAAARAPRAWAVRLHGLWFTALVALPLGMAALAAMGYFVAAAYFYTLAVHSVFLVLGALLLYGLIALWVQVQRSHLARRHDAERAPPGGADAGKALPQRLDVAALGEQTRSLLQLLITLLLVAGMWWLWRGALQVVGDYTLWTYHDTVDGKTVTHPLTVAGLSLALMVVAVTAVGVRNIGALLDIVLLQRLDVQPDATYAVKVMAQYALTAAGVVAAADILGIGWSDVQWLIAALGVGLGFGLQEIFANFISGLIVLAERPIRIGDVVTVGDVSGTVARIRARATAVVDFDNKEVIIPNKAFITERVVNWTLSNQTTRLLLKVGVAYGSDVALVQRVLLEAVGRNPGVLRHPGPSVFFVGFGDSSLDFEIRAFVGAFDQRLRVRHELLLAVDAVLREHGIEIPFPQRDVHIRSGGAGG